MLKEPALHLILHYSDFPDRDFRLISIATEVKKRPEEKEKKVPYLVMYVIMVSLEGKKC